MNGKSIVCSSHSHLRIPIEISIACSGRSHQLRLSIAKSSQPGLQLVKEQVDDGRGEECQHLRDNQSADNGDAKRATQLRTGTVTEGKWESAE